MSKKELPIKRGRFLIQQARGTIKSVIDAIVELVTNSDDSFIRDFESRGITPKKPSINICIHRKTGGQCLELAVSDHAGGIPKGQLLKAITYGEAVSGFESRVGVRGFLGRGLKESVIALGEGKLLTRKGGEVSAIRIWVDNREQRVFYDEISVNPEELSRFGLDKSNGTAVIITNISKDIKIPDYPTFEDQLKKHFALRTINANLNRDVLLNFTSETKKGPIVSESPIKFELPDAQKVFSGELSIGSKTRLTLYESSVPLDSPKNNPFALSGILVKSEGAILENTLFGYDRDDAATYFYGELDVPEIAQRLRAGEMLVDLNRTGLDWRAPFLLELSKEVNKVLIEYISKKRRELERITSTVELTASERRVMQDFCKLLSSMAKAELEEFVGPPIDPGELKTLEIRPLVANILVGTSRTFSVYIPKTVRESLPESNLEVYSTNEPYLPVISVDSTLRPHKDYREILVGKFQIEGRKLEEMSEIFATLGKYTSDPAQVVVTAQIGKPPPKRKYEPRTSGFIRSIEPAEDLSPTQRVRFDEDLGVLKILINFPGVKEFLSPWERGIKSDSGKTLLGELVSEWFCRAMAVEKIDRGELYDNSVYSFNSEFFRQQRKYLRQIHEFVQKKFPSLKEDDIL